MRRFGLFLVVSILLSAGCTNRQFYEKYAKSVDSLSASLEAAAYSYEKLDTSLFKIQFNEMSVKLDTIRSIGDTAIIKEVIEFGYVRKRYKTFLGEHPLTIKELTYSRKQLNTLKNDIYNKSLEETEVIQYFDQELEAIDYLKNRMDSYRESILRNQAKFDKLNPEITIIIDSLHHTKPID